MGTAFRGSGGQREEMGGNGREGDRDASALFCSVRFCRKMLKYSTFCRKMLNYATFLSRNAKIRFRGNNSE